MPPEYVFFGRIVRKERGVVLVMVLENLNIASLIYIEL